MTLRLGVIADDFTGATDVANTLVKSGLRVVQFIGLPSSNPEGLEAEAIVIALKSRTCPADRAVELSLQAAKWLTGHGAKQLLFKYCSTFDSSAEGNIGPVADALLDHLGAENAFVCPASPENRRSVYQGHLFVGDCLLSESSMRDHPLTPMRDSRLVRLMDAQSSHSCGLIDITTIRRGPDAITARSAQAASQGHRYFVVDALEQTDLIAIGKAARDHRLVTGAAGIAAGLAANFSQNLPSARKPAPPPDTGGRSLVLAGSCSSATRAQICTASSQWPSRKIEFDRLTGDAGHVRELVDWARAQQGRDPVLIYGSSDPDEVRRNQHLHGTKKAGDLIESAIATIAEELVGNGFNRLVIAGGETSGAVVSRLGIEGLQIGPEIEPGVPWTQTIGKPALAIALKSGNFGSSQFFENAFRMLP